MNGAFLLIVSVIIFVSAYLFYGRFLCKLFGVDSGRKTPAHTRQDGIDYVPTKLPVLFGHHFASIAGAGPIVGPVAAAYFGWLPVVLWILIGCVFIGAMHDFAALFVSIRSDGRSIGYVIERHIGYSGRQIFLLFCWAALVLVVAVFAIHVAKAFVNTPSVATDSLFFIAMAPVFGWLVHKKGVSILTASLIFVPMLFGFVYLGQFIALDLVVMLGVPALYAEKIWLVVLFVYVFIASVIPVWVLLQPRDYLNSYLLYAMMMLGFFGVVFAAPHLEHEKFAGWAVQQGGSVQHLFPILFVTVACGACSGFHSLVSSGTTAKQLDSERNILPIGYGSMLVEGVLAIMAIISVSYLSKEGAADIIGEKGKVVAFASGMATFTEKIGLGYELGRDFFTLSISAFLLTTLDTATRLTRFTWQELFHPKFEEGDKLEHTPGIMANRYVATGIAVAATSYLAFSGDTNTIWPVFGASNQLLAALTLLVVSIVLIKKKSRYMITFIPMVFMMIVSVWALAALLQENIKNMNWALVSATVFLLVMSAVLMVQAVVAIKRVRFSRSE